MYTLENTIGVIQNGQFRKNWKDRKTKQKNKTKTQHNCVPDTAMRKQTQIT